MYWLLMSAATPLMALRQTALLKQLTDNLGIGTIKILISRSTDLEAHHRKVVVGGCAVAMMLHFGHQFVDYLLRILESSMTQDFNQTIIAKLNLITVLGFIQSIGIYQQRHILDGVDVLLLEL
jgi:hypothetical protein